jgi:hypothetical protein
MVHYLLKIGKKSKSLRQDIYHTGRLCVSKKWHFLAFFQNIFGLRSGTSRSPFNLTENRDKAVHRNTLCLTFRRVTKQNPRIQIHGDVFGDEEPGDTAARHLPMFLQAT